MPLCKIQVLFLIESSCDDTAAAILQNDKVLSNVVANQLIHNQYGGVVPELASRAHQQNIVPVIDAALRKANIKRTVISNCLHARSWTHGFIAGGKFICKIYCIGFPLIAVNHASTCFSSFY
jgi:N6-L-threonylcarbamoyladenine synthase